MRVKLRFLVILMIMSLGFVAPIFVHAQSSISWMSAQNPVLSSPDQHSGVLPSTLTNYGNIDCHAHTFVTRPSRPLVQSEESHTACSVTSELGELETNGYVQLNGTQTAGRLLTAGGLDATISPVPNSSTLVYVANTGLGAELVFYDDFSRNFSSTAVGLDGKVTYKLAQTPSAVLKDKAGNIIFTRADSITYSANGQWLVADVSHVAAIRVNVKTREVIPFQLPHNYDSGQDPQTQMAVSDDGRYVMTASRFGDAQVTDISTCDSVPNHITTAVSCQTKDLAPFMRDAIPKYLWTTHIRFVQNNLITLYALYDAGNGSRAIYQYRMVPAGEQIINQDYVALGDSYSAGQGTFDYFPETDTGKDLNDCHTSPVSYPYLVGQQLQLNSYHNVACSGARIRDLTTPQKPIAPPNNTLGEWLPGLQPQLQYVKRSHPNVVTVSVYGNDIDFSGILKNCVTPSIETNTCYSTYEDRLELLTLVRSRFPDLVTALAALKNDTNPSARIFAFGYPHLAKNDGDCAINVRLNNDEIIFSNQLIDYINGVVEAAASKVGVRYIDVTEAFSGHKLCETKSSDVALNGLTLDKNEHNFIANEAYHPNKLGQQLYQTKILAETNNFALDMPQTDASSSPPAITDNMPILNGVPKTGRQINTTIKANDLTDDVVTINSQTKLQAGSNEHSLRPNSNYEVTIHSNPVDLGTYATDSSGKLETNVVIPDSVKPGFHTIHVYGQSRAGEAIDLQKVIYVASSVSDYDGDGIPNDHDPCPAIEQAGQDLDKDKIDDACDGYIGDPPVAISRPKYNLKDFILKVLNFIFNRLWFLR